MNIIHAHFSIIKWWDTDLHYSLLFFHAMIWWFAFLRCFQQLSTTANSALVKTVNTETANPRPTTVNKDNDSGQEGASSPLQEGAPAATYENYATMQIQKPVLQQPRAAQVIMQKKIFMEIRISIYM